MVGRSLWLNKIMGCSSDLVQSQDVSFFSFHDTLQPSHTGYQPFKLNPLKQYLEMTINSYDWAACKKLLLKHNLQNKVQPVVRR